MTTLMNEQQIRNKSVGEYVQQWGTSASIGILDPSCLIFQTPEVDGIIGYREGKRCLIAIGDPLCSQEDMPQLSEAFQVFSKKQNKNVVYMIATDPFVQTALNSSPKSFLQVAQELIVDPTINPTEGSKGRKLRNKISHAQRDGIEVKEYTNNDKELEESISHAAEEWLKGRKGPQIYLANVHLFSERVGKRWFYAEKNGRIVGVLLLNRLESKNGWLFNLLMATPDAPWGTTELLAARALDQLRQEKCHYATFGVVTGETLGEIRGMGSCSVSIAKFSYKMITWFFELSGSCKFWSKFNPRMENTYLLLNTPKIGFRDILDILKSLNASI